ncbi:hypothetical protein AAVH_34268 [Aphelenchoides avenae]|nr:hypothetical protein AAVH_34268 [Aphelenchus avenae]
MQTTVAEAATTEDPVSAYCTFWNSLCFGLGWNIFSVEWAVVMMFLPLYVSMIVFILAYGRREKTFRQAFYVLYVAVSMIDCLRLGMQILYNVYAAFEFIDLTDFVNQMDLHVRMLGSCAQAMLHLTIAANRFTAFFFPLEHSRIWSKRLISITFGVIGLCALLLHTAPLYGLPLLLRRKRNYDYWDPDYGQQYFIDYAVNYGVCFLCAVASMVLTIVTIVKLRTLMRSGQMRDTDNRRDAKLAVHSAFMLLMFIPATIFKAFDILAALGILTAEVHLELVRIVSRYMADKRWDVLYSLCGTPFLLLIR